jgi:hypothetical protein
MQKFYSILPNIYKYKNMVAAKAQFSKTMLFGLTITVFNYNESKAQLTATGQIRERVEVRAGQGTLQPQAVRPGVFTSQRTRLNVGFSGYRFKAFASIQDVRVWGQDASTINRTTTEANNGVLVNEAWGEVILNDTISTIENLSIKAGRQEISYDDQKVLGGLDWLQQGRRHDALILKYANKGWIADLGFAFNQNRELNTGTVYNGTNPAYAAGTNGIGTLYKSFQYLYIDKKFFFGDLSFLFFNEDFNQYTSATAGTPPVTTKTYTSGVWSRNTVGIYFNTTIKRQLNLTGSIYHQGGHDKDGLKVNANLFSITSSLQLGRKWFVGPGVDYLSGDDGTQTATENNRFDPLYGTPHKFWGYMDYFYVASPFGKQGLLNYFFKAKYNCKDNLSFLVDVHGFQAANKVSDGAGGEQSPYLGTEIDLTARYNLTKMIGLELGYGRMLAKNTLASAQVKNVANADLSPNFGYIMLTIKPNFLAKK